MKRRLRRLAIGLSALRPGAVGHHIVLDDPAPLPWWQKLIPGAELKHSIDLHADPELLEAVAEQMEDVVRGLTRATHVAVAVTLDAISAIASRGGRRASPARAARSAIAVASMANAASDSLRVTCK